MPFLSRKRRGAPRPGVDICSFYEATRGAEALRRREREVYGTGRGGYELGRGGSGMGRSRYALGRGGYGMSQDASGQQIHPAVKDGMLAAAEDGDPKARRFVQKHGLLESDAHEPEGASADPREDFGGPSRGALGGVFAGHDHGRGRRGGHRGRGGNHRGSHRGGTYQGPHSSSHGALGGGFGPPDDGHSEMESEEPPEYEEMEEGGGYGPPEMAGGRGRGWNPRGGHVQGHGMGSPAHHMMELPAFSGRGRGGVHSRGRGHIPVAPHGW